MTASEKQLETYSRYGLGGQDAKAAGGVLWSVQFPPAEVEFIREGRGEDHPDDIQVVGLLQEGVAVLQTLRYLRATCHFM